MTTINDSKLRSLAGLLSVSSLALLGLTACDTGEITEDDAVEDDGGADEADEDDVGVGEDDSDDTIGTEDDGPDDDADREDDDDESSLGD